MARSYDYNLSHLSVGRGEIVKKNNSERVNIILGDGDKMYDVGIGNRGENKKLVYFKASKTYSTKYGALVIFSENVVDGMENSEITNDRQKNYIFLKISDFSRGFNKINLKKRNYSFTAKHYLAKWSEGSFIDSSRLKETSEEAKKTIVNNFMMKYYSLKKSMFGPRPSPHNVLTSILKDEKYIIKQNKKYIGKHGKHALYTRYFNIDSTIQLPEIKKKKIKPISPKEYKKMSPEEQHNQLTEKIARNVIEQVLVTNEEIKKASSEQSSSSEATPMTIKFSLDFGDPTESSKENAKPGDDVYSVKDSSEKGEIIMRNLTKTIEKLGRRILEKPGSGENIDNDLSELTRTMTEIKDNLIDKIRSSTSSKRSLDSINSEIRSSSKRPASTELAQSSAEDTISRLPVVASQSQSAKGNADIHSKTSKQSSKMYPQDSEKNLIQSSTKDTTKEDSRISKDDSSHRLESGGTSFQSSIKETTKEESPFQETDSSHQTKSDNSKSQKTLEKSVKIISEIKKVLSESLSSESHEQVMTKLEDIIETAKSENPELASTLEGSSLIDQLESIHLKLSEKSEMSPDGQHVSSTSESRSEKMLSSETTSKSKKSLKEKIKSSVESLISLLDNQIESLEKTLSKKKTLVHGEESISDKGYDLSDLSFSKKSESLSEESAIMSPYQAGDLAPDKSSVSPSDKTKFVKSSSGEAESPESKTLASTKSAHQKSLQEKDESFSQDEITESSPSNKAKSAKSSSKETKSTKQISPKSTHQDSPQEKNEFLIQGEMAESVQIPEKATADAPHKTKEEITKSGESSRTQESSNLNEIEKVDISATKVEVGDSLASGDAQIIIEKPKKLKIQKDVKHEPSPSKMKKGETKETDKNIKSSANNRSREIKTKKSKNKRPEGKNVKENDKKIIKNAKSAIQQKESNKKLETSLEIDERLMDDDESEEKYQRISTDDRKSDKISGKDRESVKFDKTAGKDVELVKFDIISGKDGEISGKISRKDKESDKSADTPGKDNESSKSADNVSAKSTKITGKDKGSGKSLKISENGKESAKSEHTTMSPDQKEDTQPSDKSSTSESKRSKATKRPSKRSSTKSEHECAEPIHIQHDQRRSPNGGSVGGAGENDEDLGEFLVEPTEGLEEPEASFIKIESESDGEEIHRTSTFVQPEGKLFYGEGKLGVEDKSEEEFKRKSINKEINAKKREMALKKKQEISTAKQEQRLEMLRRQQIEKEMEENLQRELEENVRQKELEIMRQKEEEQERLQKEIEMKLAQERQKKLMNERLEKEKRAYNLKLQKIKEQQEEEERQRIELEKIKKIEEEMRLEKERQMIAEMEHSQYVKYMAEKEEMERQRRIREEEERAAVEEMKKLAQIENERLSAERKKQEELIIARKLFMAKLKDENICFKYSLEITRAFIYSYFELLQWVSDCEETKTTIDFMEE